MKVNGRKIVFAIVIRPGPWISEAALGVSGGVVGESEWALGMVRLGDIGPARELVCGGGDEGCEEAGSAGAGL